jgi:cytidylate kinase
MAKGLVIAIDGPAGAGKSTISKMLARELKLLYLDTGAMYRAVGFKTRALGISLKDEKRLTGMLAETEIDLDPLADGVGVVLDGRVLKDELRSPEIGMLASAVSAIPVVRNFLTGRLQQIGARGGVIAEGRDAGTVIFPKADYKFFLDADIKERVRRRYDEQLAKGIDEVIKQTEKKLIQRDHDDSNRALSPLRRAADAIYIDTTDMDISVAFKEILSYIR